MANGYNPGYDVGVPFWDNPAFLWIGLGVVVVAMVIIWVFVARDLLWYRFERLPWSLPRRSAPRWLADLVGEWWQRANPATAAAVTGLLAWVGRARPTADHRWHHRTHAAGPNLPVDDDTVILSIRDHPIPVLTGVGEDHDA